MDGNVTAPSEAPKETPTDVPVTAIVLPIIFIALILAVGIILRVTCKKSRQKSMSSNLQRHYFAVDNVTYSFFGKESRRFNAHNSGNVNGGFERDECTDHKPQHAAPRINRKIQSAALKLSRGKMDMACEGDCQIKNGASAQEMDKKVRNGVGHEDLEATEKAKSNVDDVSSILSEDEEGEDDETFYNWVLSNDLRYIKAQYGAKQAASSTDTSRHLHVEEIPVFTDDIIPSHDPMTNKTGPGQANEMPVPNDTLGKQEGTARHIPDGQGKLVSLSHETTCDNRVRELGASKSLKYQSEKQYMEASQENFAREEKQSSPNFVEPTTPSRIPIKNMIKMYEGAISAEAGKTQKSPKKSCSPHKSPDKYPTPQYAIPYAMAAGEYETLDGKYSMTKEMTMFPTTKEQVATHQCPLPYAMSDDDYETLDGKYSMAKEMMMSPATKEQVASHQCPRDGDDYAYAEDCKTRASSSEENIYETPCLTVISEETHDGDVNKGTKKNEHVCNSVKRGKLAKRRKKISTFD